MTKIEWNDEQRSVLANRLRDFLLEELDIELGRFDAESLLEFFDRELGAAYYNLALEDARATLTERLAAVLEVIDELEQPTRLVR